MPQLSSVCISKVYVCCSIVVKCSITKLYLILTYVSRLYLGLLYSSSSSAHFKSVSLQFGCSFNLDEVLLCFFFCFPPEPLEFD